MTIEAEQHIAVTLFVCRLSRANADGVDKVNGVDAVTAAGQCRLAS